MDIRAVLFDLDGTLVDSERENAEGLARVLAADFGLDLTDAQRQFVVGHGWRDIYATLVAAFGGRLAIGLPELMLRAAAERGRIIAEIGLTVLPGAREAIGRLRGHRALGLVTGSSRLETQQSLAYLGVEGEFDVVVCAEDVQRGKPSPDGYLLAARRLGVVPATCAVIEDSSAGIAAGRRAGMVVVAVRAGNFLGQDQAEADLGLETLAGLTEDVLETLGRSGPRAARDA